MKKNSLIVIFGALFPALIAFFFDSLFPNATIGQTNNSVLVLLLVGVLANVIVFFRSLKFNNFSQKIFWTLFSAIFATVLLIVAYVGFALSGANI